MLNVVSFLKKELLVLLNTRQKVLLRAALKYLEGWGMGVMDSCRHWKERNAQLQLTTFRCEEHVVQTSLWGMGFLAFTMAQGGSKPHLTGQALCG